MTSLVQPKPLRFCLCARIFIQATAESPCLSLPRPCASSAMDISNSSWSIFASTLASAVSAKVPPPPPFYLVPFVVWTHEPAGVVRAKEEEKAPITESCDRRAMTTWNSDGHAYSLDEFTEYFGKYAGLEQWRKAVPVVKMERPLPPQPGFNMMVREK